MSTSAVAYLPSPPTARTTDRSGLPRSFSRREIVLWLAALAIALAWAAWPITTISQPGREARSLPSLASVEPRVALDVAAFKTPLWVAPPTPPPPPAPLPPPPALTLQLLAIVTEQGGLRAMVYDPASDKVLTLAAGDTLGPRTVASLTATTVGFKLKDQVQTLSLDRASTPESGGRTRP